MKLSFGFLLLPGLLTACGAHSLDAGQEDAGHHDAGEPDAGPPDANPQDAGLEDGGPGDASNDSQPPPPGSCATLTLGVEQNPSSVSACATMFLGRWTLCADDAGVQDASSALGFKEILPQPAGIEFAQENGAVDFYMLEASDGGLVRTQNPALRGTTVDGTVVGAGCTFWMAPDSNPGDQTDWTLERFQSPAALLINGSASYVVAPPAP